MQTTHRRQEVLSALREKIDEGKYIIGAGAGTGLSAKCEEKGGVDLIVVYNSGRYRMAGRGSLSGLLAYGNANEIVVEMAREVLTVVDQVPVLAGVNGTDPFMQARPFLKELQRLGYSGIQNFPTVGLIDGNFRQSLEETGMGYGLEVECIREAAELGMLTTPYVFNESEAVAMAEAGADILVAHMGLTTGGSIGAQTGATLDDSVARIRDIIAAARAIRDDLIFLCHGGPISMPDDAAYVLEHVDELDGFYGASSMERLPTEVAIQAQVARFAELRRSGAGE